MKKLILLSTILSLLANLSVSEAQIKDSCTTSPILIDDFSDNSSAYDGTVDIYPATTISESFMGYTSNRSISAFLSNGLSVLGQTNNGKFVFSSGPLSTGSVTIEWRNKLDPISLSRDKKGVIMGDFTFNNPESKRVDIIVTLYNSETRSIFSQGRVVLNRSYSHEDILIPFSEFQDTGSVDFNSIGAIDLTINTGKTEHVSFDFSSLNINCSTDLSSSQALPEPTIDIPPVLCIECASAPTCQSGCSGGNCCNYAGGGTTSCCGSNPQCIAETSVPQTTCSGQQCGYGQFCDPNSTIINPPPPPPIPTVNGSPVVYIQVGDDGSVGGPSNEYKCNNKTGLLGINSRHPQNNDNDCLRAQIMNPGIYTEDFRFCLMLNYYARQCTPWASEGGGVSNFIISPNSFSLASIQVETRPSSGGKTYSNTGISLQLFYQSNNSACGAGNGPGTIVSTTGPLSSWTWVQGDNDPGCAKIGLTTTINTPPAPTAVPTNTSVPYPTTTPVKTPTPFPTSIATPVATRQPTAVPTPPVGCDGIPGSGKKLDNCGICGGNNACQNTTQCTQKDISSFLFALDGVTNSLKNTALSTNKTLVKFGGKKYEKQYNSVKTQATKLNTQAWTAMWAYGQIVLSCPSSVSSCQLFSYANNAATIDTTLRKLTEFNNKAASQLLKFKNKNAQKAGKNAKTKGKKQLDEARSILKKLPESRSVCR